MGMKDLVVCDKKAIHQPQLSVLTCSGMGPPFQTCLKMFFSRLLDPCLVDMKDTYLATQLALCWA